MKIHKDIRPETAISKDKRRTAIREPYLDIKEGKGTLVVTDGRILAAIPVDVSDTDASGYLSAAVLKAGRKASRGEIADIGANGVATLADGSTMPRAGEAADNNFPNWRAVVPDEYDETAIEIGLDALRLWQLAQAIGTQGVKLRFKLGADGPILVYPISCGKYADGAPVVCPDARGVIVPIKLPEKSTPATT